MHSAAMMPGLTEIACDHGAELSIAEAISAVPSRLVPVLGLSLNTILFGTEIGETVDIGGVSKDESQKYILCKVGSREILCHPTLPVDSHSFCLVPVDINIGSLHCRMFKRSFYRYAKRSFPDR